MDDWIDYWNKKFVKPTTVMETLDLMKAKLNHLTRLNIHNDILVDPEAVVTEHLTKHPIVDDQEPAIGPNYVTWGRWGDVLSHDNQNAEEEQADDDAITLAEEDDDEMIEQDVDNMEMPESDS
ncbi:hypothetical protein RvY_05445 [Ramazzottius varieornatus]|uniref:Uncharacterized protein n=1 Tax=Ramazzottius varieornatus TaxID=947166 RepID=A0A1D1UYN7_RAMVA|nr:hypothetical protein RvY_05445 [Ramazzottius varieornatus]